ncbi:hypothetical protein AND_000694 [Anopheles darlingi]|uniref:Secreted protein n=1 Tax=Anopheles darlingi TaxID=43151 RepID=W5JWC5_ANODA|nr:hypothetical protein AND_000694 [Anopheles darlingi]
MEYSRMQKLLLIALVACLLVATITDAASTMAPDRSRTRTTPTRRCKPTRSIPLGKSTPKPYGGHSKHAEHSEKIIPFKMNLTEKG